MNFVNKLYPTIFDTAMNSILYENKTKEPDRFIH